MTVEIIEEAPEALPEYEKVFIAFCVESYFRVELCPSESGGFRLIEEKAAPSIKDYDENEKDKPSQWPRRWDLSSWGLFSAFAGQSRVGGAAVAWNTSGMDMLEDDDRLACLWDLRVHPDYRGKGVGHQLFARALEWARARGCHRLVVETQNINVPACRFYARQGCELGAVSRDAYEKSLNEIQLLWYRNL